MMISDVKRMTAIFYGITRDEIEGQSRRRIHARPRQVAMMLCRRYTRHSMPQIGQAFGGRDHTTVIHAIKAVTSLTAKCPEEASELALLCQQIEAGEIVQISTLAQERRQKLEAKAIAPSEDDRIQAAEPEAHCAYARALTEAKADFSNRHPGHPLPNRVRRNLSGPAPLPSPDTFPLEAAE